MSPRFQKKTKGKDYFVVTLLQELERQPKLQNLLSEYAVREQSDDYIIYDLNQPSQKEN